MLSSYLTSGRSFTMAVTLNDEKILDQWGAVIECGAGKDATLLQSTQDMLRNSELPGVAWQKVDAQPSMLKGLFGNKRSYLMVTCEAVSSLPITQPGIKLLST